jgi:hypothetical protein
MEAEILQHMRALDEKSRELQHANTGLMQYAKQARDEAKNKDEFLATFAHELRNPLAGISTALDLMAIVGDDAAAATQYREVCKRQLGNLTRLVNDLLDVSRVSREGSCRDNAPTESLWGSLKVARLHGARFETRRAAIDAIIDWLSFYKHRRLHWTLGYVTPCSLKGGDLPISFGKLRNELGYGIRKTGATNKATVKLTNKHEYQAQVMGADPCTDVAFIKINATGVPVVKIGDPGKIESGEWGTAIRAPFDIGVEISKQLRETGKVTRGSSATPRPARR